MAAYFNELSEIKNREYFVLKNNSNNFYYIVPPTQDGSPDMNLFNFFTQLDINDRIYNRNFMLYYIDVNQVI